MARPWDAPTWLAEAREWVSGQLGEQPHSFDLMHQYTWSSMVRVESSRGVSYFKATAPAMRFEAALTDALTRWRPDVTVDLLAHDSEHGWLLMADSGMTLRELNPAHRNPEVIRMVFATYAQLQIDTVTQADKYLGLGLPERSVSSVVAGGKRLGIAPELLDALALDVGRVALPITLVHEEVHDANVLIRDGIPVFIDWSDSSVGHPFFGTVVALRSASDKWELEPGDAFLEELVDAYLEPWTYLAPLSELRSIFASAYRLGMLNRALSWEVGTSGLSEEAAREDMEYVAAWLEEFSAATDPKPGT